MKFSTKATYGIRALLRLANEKGTGPVSIAQIAKGEGLSPDYLERIFASLRKQGLVVAEKGMNGGYVLAKPADKIDLLDVIVALEGKPNSFSCPARAANQSNCQPNCSCAADLGLSFVQSQLDAVLRQITLARLEQEKFK